MSSEQERILKSSVQEWNHYVNEQEDQDPFWRASLQGADLCNENLRGAKLSGADLARADLSHTNLTYVDLRGVNFALADLTHANLSGAKLHSSALIGADLTEAHLTLANLKDANLTCANFRGANLRGSNLQDANLAYADLQDANLTSAELQGANLHGVLFKGVLFVTADLRGVNLQGANLTSANLRGADLQGANLQGADLQGVNLQGAYLATANLRDADFRGADLFEAFLRGADLRGADLRGAKLFEADLTGVDLRDVLTDGAPYGLRETTASEMPALASHDGHSPGKNEEETVTARRLVLTIDAKPGMDTSEFSALVSGLDTLIHVSRRINSKPTGEATGGNIAVAVDPSPEDWKIAYFQYGSPWQVILDYIGPAGFITGTGFFINDVLKGENSKLINLLCLLGRPVEREEFLKRRRIKAVNCTLEEKLKGAKLRASIKLESSGVEEVSRRLEEAGLVMKSDHEESNILDSAHLMCRQGMHVDIYAPSGGEEPSRIN